MHILAPYSTPSAINRELGFEGGDADGSIRVSDSIYLLVFVQDGSVVRAFEHDVGGGHFACVVAPVVEGGLTRREAVLRAIEVPADDGGSIAEVALARPRTDREAARVDKCLETYT